jgi:hypothetical protein
VEGFSDDVTLVVVFVFAKASPARDTNTSIKIAKGRLIRITVLPQFLELTIRTVGAHVAFERAGSLSYREEIPREVITEPPQFFSQRNAATYDSGPCDVKEIRISEVIGPQPKTLPLGAGGFAIRDDRG